MRLRNLAVEATLILLISVFALGQSTALKTDSLYARLSYTTGHGIDWNQQPGNPRICIALYRSGYYQLSRLTEMGTETLQGMLSKDQRWHFRRLVESLDFQSSEGAVTRKGAEIFLAEVVHNRTTTRYAWVNPDDERPFPSSAVGIVKFLQDFKPENASPLTVRELGDQPSICPVASNPSPAMASVSPQSCEVSKNRKR